MKSIVLITYNTPSSENIRGTSALPYHIRMGTILNANVNANDNFIIYSFNNNGLSDEKIAEVEKELKCTIKKVPLPGWYQWMFKLHLLFLRIFLKYPFTNFITLQKKYVEEIKAQQPDLIWVMGEEQSRIVKQFPEFRRIQIGPDTESLYYYRMMGRRFVMNNPIEYWKCALMYRKYARMEREFCTDENFTYYAVGEEDVRHLQQLNPKVKAKFLRHPHYEVRQHFVNDNVNANDNRKFHQPKIKVLIAGRYDLYMKQEADLLIQEWKNGRIEELKSHYSYTFLGKGWEKHVETMRQAGYEVEHIRFAPDYIEEICKHDIQITPIAIGTGTKGKVLDALANGLLVIGTPYAMENIAVEHGTSCIVYREPQEVIKILMDIVKNDNVNVNDNEMLRYENSNRRKYEEIAAEGQRQVLKHHDRKLIAQQLFDLQHTDLTDLTDR
jgi:hypothetical protein